MNQKTCVIFGGSGCIGTQAAQYLLEHADFERIYLADLQAPCKDKYARRLQQGLQEGRVVYVLQDVRQPITAKELPARCDLIINLAATHREPGHPAQEYYKTNIPGAENVCAYASAAGASQILFTSSISPYGSSEAEKNEDTLPIPDTPYGGSKLVAEKIHLAWQQADPSRGLVILRPGVVFGPGEHANVARLVRSLVKGYFVYTGNRRTRKAGVYVKELCRVMQFALEYQKDNRQPQLLWNVSMDPPPTLEAFVRAICNVTGLKRRPISISRSMLVGVSYPIDAIAHIFGIQQPVNPVRMRKIFRSTNIEPKRLREAGYQWHYTLEQAFADWKQDAPEDFHA
ncbi:MAG TPA: NAD-dependent epimerase/dehydratase family protein [Acidobacteriaceae bacterium]|jgi:nucleoside-diphosphate-sugar epimerase|nr:NAD-dependent epimerase/dehydratase family protein [Acidobacteriaceae bacterium]